MQRRCCLSSRIALPPTSLPPPLPALEAGASICVDVASTALKCNATAACRVASPCCRRHCHHCCQLSKLMLLSASMSPALHSSAMPLMPAESHHPAAAAASTAALPLLDLEAEASVGVSVSVGGRAAVQSSNAAAAESRHTTAGTTATTASSRSCCFCRRRCPSTTQVLRCWLPICVASDGGSSCIDALRRQVQCCWH